ncbi:oligosaccharyl transferase, STT3 subunit [Thermococcus siculi]|uniref:dolichyl-phosphooligosaccharide-protein glycotransferase n=1 Tax=Thermococcus siculi TaxID=72803 RepID=A0A2Z2MNZ9_9EURY|nr:STT3 domain-containing protein [Thermococcus siculi]ASJ08364.1 oligosaccharyl transferase, STT3 subunit [Thermococcus siculi]
MRSENAFDFLRSLWERMLEPKYAVLILTVIASAIRLLPMRFRYLLGYDPYFHLAYIRYALQKGEWVNFFPYTYAPYGSLVRGPLGFWMTPAYIYRLLSHLGLSLYNSFRLTPVVFGVLTVVFLYLSILLLYGKVEAFLSAFFLSVMFAHVFRSMAGYYRGDNYMLFWYSLSLFGISLALSKKAPSWRYKRLGFYLIPGFSAGFAAIFWQAYYPIFGFLLANAIGIGTGAFLLRKDKYIWDSLILVLAGAGGALLANFLGGRFRYGMLAVSWGLGRWIAKEFGLHSDLINDTFLLFYLKYAVPLSLGLLVLLLIFSRLIRDNRLFLRLLVVSAYALTVILVGLKYYGLVSELLAKLFPASPIAETQRTALSDLWAAYGLGGIISPFFFLGFVPSRIKVRDFLLLGLLLLVLPMILLWTRFLFIGSFVIALMAGIGLVRMYEVLCPRMWNNSPAAVFMLALLISLPLTTAIQGVHNTLTLKPIMDDHWERGLTYLGKNSNITDVVLDWWDHGYWIIYYSQRSVIAQAGPNRWVSQYYLGLRSEKELMKMGVDYIIVSYDAIMKFGSLLETANVSPREYALVVLPGRESYGNLFVFSNGLYSLIAAPGKTWDVKVNLGNSIVIPKRVFVETPATLGEVSLSGRPTADVYVYINLNYGYAVIMNGRTFDTPLARLMFTSNYSRAYSLLYSDGGYIKVFRFEHPNVVVIQENSSIVLKFTNSTGTGLRIYGYLDNGTLVFKKRYGVKRKEEFVLPENINGSVVVRYIYAQEKTILDRGVFRIDDV